MQARVIYTRFFVTVVVYFKGVTVAKNRSTDKANRCNIETSPINPLTDRRIVNGNGNLFAIKLSSQ